jgi:ribulose-phosphate 3-epimerase
MAAADPAAGPFSLRQLPGAVQADVALPDLWRALDDRADARHGEHGMHAVRQLDVETGLKTGRDLIGTAQVQPSILAADYSRLGEQLQAVLDAGARAIHVDVMDGRFVPPITIGPVVVESIRDQVHAAGGLLDCHLMVERPESQIDQFVEAGADSITIQVEATPNVHNALKQIREAGCLAGLAINPGTPPESVAELAGTIDLVLCMTVNPGWGGQAFIEGSPGKVERLRALVGDELPIQVDGGISAQTVGSVAGAGARLFVAGSAIFGKPDPAAAYREIAAAAGIAEDA